MRKISFEAWVASKLDKDCKCQTVQHRWEAVQEKILDSAKDNNYENYQTSVGKKAVDNRRND